MEVQTLQHLLTCICRWDRLEDVKQLLEKYQSMDVTFDDGECFQIAIQNNNIQLFELLFRHYKKLHIREQNHDEYCKQEYIIQKAMSISKESYDLSSEMMSVINELTNSSDDYSDDIIDDFDDLVT